MGRAVRFDQTVGRNIPNNFLYYGVKPGVGAAADFPACTPASAPNAPFVYTPTRADIGIITVSELAAADNTLTPPRGSTYYTRTFRVYDNAPPTFTVAPCPGSNALVTITDATYDSYTVQAGTGAVLTIAAGQPKANSIPLNGATSITVRGFYTAPNLCESQPSTQTVPALAAPQTPLLSSFTLQAPLPSGAATLAVGQLPAGYTYTLQRTDASAPGGYATVASVPAGSTSFALATVTNSGYRLLRTDPCNGPTDASEQLYPISLSGNSTQNRNQLLFSDGGAPGTTYTVTRDDIPFTAFTVIPGGLEDATGTCKTRYRYRVTATYPRGGKSVSNEINILTQSNLPPPQPKLLASFNVRNVVELTPLLTPSTLPAGSTLYYRKASGGGTPTDLATTTTARPARDSTALADLRAAPPCYSLRQTDVCENPSPESATTCPALLSASPADADGSTAVLSWTPFTGPDPSQPATYVLLRLDSDNNVLPGSVTVTGNTYTDLTPPTDRQALRYRLQISGAGLPAGMYSYSNIATVTRQLFLTIPTAFTPNGDGLNDVLEVKGKYLNNYNFVVVDRNGQEVFRGTKRADVWDGTIRGHAPAMGSYVWRFSQNNEDGSPFTATGTVNILK
ncbi:T9SS type B sorting domain-containing protein [Hymenobacter properus]|uniref:Gliding motility-associated C-terminal domain-containing protein n=1 Tax=Hymenobacter properus TaxID=2791026 RepID=A0A931FLA5_9BACT|nr:gliding motility-associated C-terminal domain-containing protein [Hymenobacter properus]MBF9143968.1 gliding motility-associated C-terminal domain-containing protein [Hymenobacter properus]MBR7722783.1 gliding motility-associated C-terminal domain-containing protein [Microvirga sp. SRT04]